MWFYLTAPPSYEPTQSPFANSQALFQKTAKNSQPTISIHFSKSSLPSAEADSGKINWAPPKITKGNLFEQVQKYVYGKKMPDGSVSAPPLKIQIQLSQSFNMNECNYKQFMNQHEHFDEDLEDSLNGPLNSYGDSFENSKDIINSENAGASESNKNSQAIQVSSSDSQAIDEQVKQDDYHQQKIQHHSWMGNQLQSNGQVNEQFLKKGQTKKQFKKSWHDDIQFQKKVHEQIIKKMNNIHVQTKDIEYPIIDY